MKFKKTEPTLYAFAPNRTTQYGAIPTPLHLNINYRFNTFSEMSFEVRKYYYDDREEKWVKNPVYDNIEKNNLIKIPNDNPVYKYKVDELYEDSEYDLPRRANGSPDYSQQPNSQSSAVMGNDGLFYSGALNHAELYKETELFDVGSTNGYGWSYGKKLQVYNNNGSIIPIRSGDIVNDTPFQKIANENFFPIQVGDIIAYGCRKNSSGHFVKDSTYVTFGFCPFFYSQPETASCTHVGDRDSNDNTNYSYNPIGRRIVKDGFLGDYSWGSGRHHNYVKNGYVRFQGKDVSANHTDYTAWLVNSAFIKILSGERRCKTIYSNNEDVVLEHGIPWWVIVNVEKNEDGINPVKKVTAYSYEYTLSNRSFSVDDDTLPLYIPDNIPKVVTSDEFPYDKVDGTVYCGAQRMKRGLINQILDNTSGWKVRYISTKACVRYRQIDSVDNANIYTYLMNTVQSKYQCFIIFDVENLYINIIDYGDIVGKTTSTGAIIKAPAIDKSGVIIDWRNALKSMTVKNIDDNYATALKIHSEEDTYSIGLINPNGSNVIYNFDNIKDKLDYVADSKHLDSNDEPYTLKQLIEIYQNDISSTGSNSDLTKYRNYATTLINNNVKLLELESNMSKKLAEYQRLVSKNNIAVDIKYGSSGLPDLPPLLEEFGSNEKYSWGSTTEPYPNNGYHQEIYGWVRICWESRDMCYEVQQLAQNYWDAYNNYMSYQSSTSQQIYNMKQIAVKYSLNINTLNEQFDSNNTDGVPTSGYKPIFTPTEAKELFKYIYESDWTNENVVFNDDYSADDIYDTLVDLYDTATLELSQIYNKPVYDFESDIANITHMPEMKDKCKNLYLGSSLYIKNDDKWGEPLLLEIKFDYDNYDYSPMVFTTDYNRKPKEMRFYELFSTINQTSVTTPTYTFDN